MGTSLARHDIFIFTDDDCRVDRHYFAVLAQLHSKIGEPAIIGGRVELGDPTDAPITIKTDMAPAKYGVDSTQFPGGFIHGCNLTMHREVLDGIGLWNERFGPAGIFRAAEDTEMIYRANKHGVPIIYHPDLVVHHFHGRKTIEDIKKLNQSYQYGNGALLGRHLDALPLKHFY
ncbi:glycosyltransferase [Aurantiacibacter xanthus]|uniref:Glycosyltransferase n=2 Tax=Aurantiacibacter xanthus TaxID=1784712 RepID=A0A3A1P6S4_9SPHN|nr:glycosyltransferase [Aurantiacibacter xanthus]